MQIDLAIFLVSGNAIVYDLTDTYGNDNLIAVSIKALEIDVLHEYCRCHLVVGLIKTANNSR